MKVGVTRCSVPTPVVLDLTTRPRLRVLLVDDGPADRELAREVFDHHCAHVLMTTCASGEQALAMLQDPDTMRPDVILLDLNMPGLSGLDVLEVLKRHAGLSVIPVVIPSNSSHPWEVERAYALHASSFLIKQVDFGRFVQQIDAFVAFWREARVPD